MRARILIVGLIAVWGAVPALGGQAPFDVTSQNSRASDLASLEVQTRHRGPWAETGALSTGDEQPMLFDDTVVRDVRLTFAESDWVNYLSCVRRQGPGSGSSSYPERPAKLTVDGVTLDNVGVRCKGNSSLGIRNDKKPLNVTTDAFVPGQDLWGYDVINLDNNWSDPSQLRSAIGLRLMREYMPAPRFGFARVTIQGRYVGLYTMVEQVSGEFAAAWYPNDDGMVIKGDSPVRIAFNSSTLQWLGESLAPYRQGYEVKGRAARSDEGYVALRELTRALDAPVSAGGLDPSAFPEGISQKLDVETALWYLALCNLTDNFDSYYVGKNYFMYVGGRDGRFRMVPWDVGLGFGIFGLQMAGGVRPGVEVSPARVDPFVQADQANRPLIRRLLALPEYRADYLAHYRALLDEVYQPTWIEALGKRYQALIGDAVRDEVRSQGSISGAYTFAQYESNLYEPVGGGFASPGLSAPGILALVTERRAYLAAQEALRPVDVRLVSQSIQPGQPTLADPVWVSAKFAGSAAVQSVQLRYRVDGQFETKVAMVRQPDGSYTATIPPQRPSTVVTYVFRVGTVDGRAAFFPSATLTKPYAYVVTGVSLPRQEADDLVINELMSDNQAAIADEAGEYDDWLELFNRGRQPVGLDGYYLSDDETDPWAYALPDLVLEPGERLLVWCDNDPEQGPLHADFGLSKNGEQVLLSTRQAIVDRVDFGPLRPDESLMRLPDGGVTWVVCRVSTPRQANACPPDSVATPTSLIPTSPPGPSVTPGATNKPPTPYATSTATGSPTPGRPSATISVESRVHLPLAMSR